MKKTISTQDSPAPSTMTLPVLNAQAAGIDVGSRFHVVAVGQDKDKDVYTFGVTTPDLHEMAKFLQSRNIQTIAMESTGYYWIPLYWMLQSYDFKVMVVNPSDIKRINAPKTDVQDARWIQKLHALSLLKPSFQLDSFGESLRAYVRRRRTIIGERNRAMNRMHKTLILMNVQIGTQISDLGGASGTDVITAIVKGERNPDELLKLMHGGIKTPKSELLKALQGTWQPHYLFELKQLYENYQSLGKQLEDCDVHIEAELVVYCQANNITPPDADKKPETAEKKVLTDKNGTSLQVVRTLQALTGINLIEIKGVGSSFILDAAAELGFTLEQFPTDKHFTSWLGLAPRRKVSGGKVLSSATPKRANPAAQAFRQVANAVGNSKEHPLKAFFCSILKKQGRTGAITATARKIAVIYYHMIKDKTPFNYEKTKEQINKQRTNLIHKVQKIINDMNITPDDIRFAT